MRNSTKKFAIVFLAFLMCLSGCKNNGAIAEENVTSSVSEAEFSGSLYSSDNNTQSEAVPENNNPTFSSDTCSLKQEDSLLIISHATEGNDSTLDERSDSNKRNIVKKLIEYALAENKEIVSLLDSKAYKRECNISLMNILDDDNPEILLSFRTANNVETEYLYAMDENSVPVCMGSFVPSTEFSGIYMDSFNTYYITYCGCHSFKDNLYWMNIDRLKLPKEAKVSPDFAEYQNSDALDFVNNTHMYFIRYDNWDWDSEKQSWKNPEELAAMFYYEDSGLYEAYSASKRMLDLAAFEINDYINDDGNHIYSYLPGENYLVSRREYEQIKSKVFEKLTKVTDEPVISSGWIDIEDVNKWIDALE